MPRRRTLRKNNPRIRLQDLLRRRKTNLRAFVLETGSQTYGDLVRTCTSMGVQPVPEQDWVALCMPEVTVPADGIVILGPMPVIAERDGAPVEPEEARSEPTIDTQKRPRRKRALSSGEDR